MAPNRGRHELALGVVAAAVFLSGLFLTPGDADAGWLRTGSISGSSDPAIVAGNNARCVAADADEDGHAVWSQGATGSTEVHYRRYSNSLCTWLADTSLTAAAGASNAPCVATDGSGRVHVIWQDDRDGNLEIYYKRFDGSAWGSDERLTSDSSYSGTPSVAADRFGRVHVVWRDYRDGDYEIYYKINDGSAWGSDERLTTSAGTSSQPSVAVDSAGNPHVVWQDNADGTTDIYYKAFDGVAWGAAEKLSDSSSTSSNPCIAIGPDGDMYAIWQGKTGQITTFWYRKFGGVSWGTETEVPGISGNTRPQIAVGTAGSMHLVWSAVGCKYKYFDGTSWQPNDTLSVSPHGYNGGGVARAPSGKVLAVWSDGVTEAGDACVYCAMRVDVALPAPQAVSADPDSGAFGEVASIDSLAGDDFLWPMKVWLQRTGFSSVVATDVNVHSCEQVSCDLDLSAVNYGYWDIVVENPDLQKDTLSAAYYVIPLPAPTLTSITPASCPADEAVFISDLAGDNFVSPVSVWLSADGEPDIPAEFKTVSSQQITCVFDLRWKAPGDRDLNVKNADGYTVTMPAGFPILPAVWGPDTLMDASVGTIANNNAKSIATGPGQTAYAVWQSAGLVLRVYDGTEWGPETVLTPGISAITPAIAVDDDGGVHLVYRDDLYGYLYYMCNKGTGWSTPQSLSDGASLSSRPSICAGPGGVVHVAWRDTMWGEGAYYRRFNGAAWDSTVLLSEVPDSVVEFTTIAVDGEGSVYAFYRDIRNSFDIGYSFSSGDYAWEPETLIVSGPQVSDYPSAVGALDRGVHLVWTDTRDGYAEIYYKHFDGDAWGPEIRLSTTVTRSYNPSIAIDDSSNLHVVWADQMFNWSPGRKHVWYMRTAGGTWGRGHLLTFGESDDSEMPSVAVGDCGEVHVLWRQTLGGYYPVWRMRSPVGSAGVDVAEKPDRPAGIVGIVPNPVRSAAEINLRLGAGPAHLSIYDVAGRLVRRYDFGESAAGPLKVTWDGKDGFGEAVAGGIYFARLEGRHPASTAKIVLLK